MLCTATIQTWQSLWGLGPLPWTPSISTVTISQLYFSSYHWCHDIWYLSQVLFFRNRSHSEVWERDLFKLISLEWKSIFRSFFHQNFQNQSPLLTRCSNLANAESHKDFPFNLCIFRPALIPHANTFKTWRCLFIYWTGYKLNVYACYMYLDKKAHCRWLRICAGS